MDIQTILADAADKIGAVQKIEGLLRKTARLKPGASGPEDVLGFDFLIRYNNTCYEYYAATPPLKGFTQPVPVACPLGIQVFDTFKVDYKTAIDIFHQGDWGSGFTSIILSKPLVPKVTEPYWNFMSNLGVNVVIGADTGEIVYPN